MIIIHKIVFIPKIFYFLQLSFIFILDKKKKKKLDGR